MKITDVINEALDMRTAKKYTKAWKKSKAGSSYYDDLFAKNNAKYRIYIPFETTDAVKVNIPKEITSAAEIVGGYFDQDYDLDEEHYIKGYFFYGKAQLIKIGKILQKYIKEVEALEDKSEYLSDLTTVKRAYRILMTDSQRDSSKNNKKLYMVISRHPYDIAGMSTDRHWSSCMNLKGGAYKEFVMNDVKFASLIAYIVYETDKNINNPVSRITIKRFTNKKKKSDFILVPENRMYGSKISGFKEALQKWIDSVNGDKATGLYCANDGAHLDSIDNEKFNLNTTTELIGEKEQLKLLSSLVDSYGNVKVTNDETIKVLSLFKNPSNKVVKILLQHFGGRSTAALTMIKNITGMNLNDFFNTHLKPIFDQHNNDDHGEGMNYELGSLFLETIKLNRTNVARQNVLLYYKNLVVKNYNAMHSYTFSSIFSKFKNLDEFLPKFLLSTSTSTLSHETISIINTQLLTKILYDKLRTPKYGNLIRTLSTSEFDPNGQFVSIMYDATFEDYVISLNKNIEANIINFYQFLDNTRLNGNIYKKMKNLFDSNNEILQAFIKSVNNQFSWTVTNGVFNFILKYYSNEIIKIPTLRVRSWNIGITKFNKLMKIYYSSIRNQEKLFDNIVSGETNIELYSVLSIPNIISNFLNHINRNYDYDTNNQRVSSNLIDIINYRNAQLNSLSTDDKIILLKFIDADDFVDSMTVNISTFKLFLDTEPKWSTLDPDIKKALRYIKKKYMTIFNKSSGKKS